MAKISMTAKIFIGIILTILIGIIFLIFSIKLNASFLTISVIKNILVVLSISAMVVLLFLKVSLTSKIFISLLLGTVVGLTLGENAAYIKPLGDIFLKLIRMLIVPLIFATLSSGIMSLKNNSKATRIAGKTIIFYFITSGIAVSFGVLVAILLKPGFGGAISQDKISILTNGMTATSEAVQLTGIDRFNEILKPIFEIVPKNPIDAMASGNTLQIIFFAVMFGVAANLIGAKSSIIKNGLEAISEVMFKMTEIVMAFAPIGIFGLISSTIGIFGADVILSLLKILLTTFTAYGAHIIIVFGLGGIIFRIPFLRYWKGLAQVGMVAFSTSSSTATLPVSINVARKHFGVSKPVASFVLPLGATINMDGTSIYQGVCAVFIAQLLGIELTIIQYLTIICVSVVAAIGTAGVPGAGLIMLSIVLSSIGLPLELIGLIAGIDRLLDMGRTALNVMGDMFVCTAVAKTENEITNIDDKTTVVVDDSLK